MGTTTVGNHSSPLPVCGFTIRIQFKLRDWLFLTTSSFGSRPANLTDGSGCLLHLKQFKKVLIKTRATGRALILKGLSSVSVCPRQLGGSCQAAAEDCSQSVFRFLFHCVQLSFKQPLETTHTCVNLALGLCITISTHLCQIRSVSAYQEHI